MSNEELGQAISYLCDIADDAELLAMIEMAGAMASGANIGQALMAANVILLPTGRKPFTFDYIKAAMQES